MDSLKKDWQDADVEIPHNKTEYESIMGGSRRTALDNLVRRYRWFSNMSLLMLLFVPLNFMNSHVFPDLNARVLCVVVFSVFFLTCSIMDRWLYQGLKTIDIVIMPVAEVVGKAVYYRKWHIRFIFILLPFALSILGLLAWGIDDIYLRLGMLVGFLVGVALGVRQLLAFLADYRALTSD